MTWAPFDSGQTLGRVGTENGVILREEEYGGSARIALEQGCRASPFAITCGVYGWMVHTRFFAALEVAESEYERMKVELARIATTIPLTGDPDLETKVAAVSLELRAFVTHFP